MKTILIIDDDVSYAEDLGEILGEELPNCSVVHHPNWGKAREWLASGQTPSAVILDSMLPLDGSDVDGSAPPNDAGWPNGVRVLEELTQVGIPAPIVVVITALMDRNLRDHYVELGVLSTQVLFKPARVSEILAQIHRVLARPAK